MLKTTRLPSVLLPPSTGEVLVVEDDRELRETSLEMLALGGFVAAGVENGAEALKFLSKESVQIILLDLHMPVLDGWEFLRLRSRNPALAAVPVVILSGEPQEPDLFPLVEGWLPKPFTEEALLDVVGNLLRKLQLSQDQASQPSATNYQRRSR